MIKNQKQLKVAQKKVQQLCEARNLLSDDKTAWNVHTDLIDELSFEIDEFKEIESGRVNEFVIRSLDDLGEAVVKARIAKGFTHKQLAALLEVSEQSVQRDEASDFENIRLSRMADLLDVLGFQLKGSVTPRHARQTGVASRTAADSANVNANQTRPRRPDLTWGNSVKALVPDSEPRVAGHLR